MHYQILAWLFAGIALFFGIAFFVLRDWWHAGRPRKGKADDRYQCKLSANREYEAQQRRHHLA